MGNIERQIRNALSVMPLREDIYRRDETNLIDREFKVILDYLKKDDNLDNAKRNKIDLDEKFKKQINNIEKYMKQLLNASIILRFDVASKPKRIDFGMCIFPSNEELHNKIRKAETDGKGFYLYECHNCLVLMDLGFFGLCKKYDLNERCLTAVLLHELGHKIYVKRQNELNYSEITGDKDIDGNSNKSKIVICITNLAGAFLIPVSMTNPVFMILYLLGLGFGNLVGINYNLKSNVYRYVKSEGLSDSVPVRYGYGYEIAKTMDIFYAITKTNNASSNKFIKWLRNNLFSAGSNEMNASRLRRQEVLEVLKQELDNPNNSNAEKKILKKIIADVEQMIVKNEDYKINLFCEDLKTLNEVLTFRSIEMDRARKILNSPNVLDKIYKQLKKGYHVVHTVEELNPLSRKVVENKIREMAEVTKTNTVKTDVDVNTKVGVSVGGEHSKTTLELRNIVCMEIQNFLCIVEGNDKGRITSITTIFKNEGESIKFIKFQSSLFKF